LDRVISANDVTVDSRIKEVSFDVKRNQMLAITGNNRAGKSSIMEVLSTRIASTGGSITIAGEDLSTLIMSKKNQLFGFVPSYDYL
jgi:ABC-type multidrug transport system ATPase subunit